MKTPLELGQWPLSYSGWSWGFLFPWHGTQEMSQRVTRGAAPLSYCGACTESGCICTQLLGFERIGSALLFVQVLAFSSLISPPISVFAAPALLLGNKYKLAFSHPLTNFHSTFNAHGSVSGICLLDVSLHCCFFPLKVWTSLEIGTWRFILLWPHAKISAGSGVGNHNLGV